MTAGAVSTPLIIPIIPLQIHKAKNHINTNTPVSIQSDTLGALIFYTLDGSIPAAVHRGASGSTRKYRKPILLPTGRVPVRAVAVTSDGRESSTVTKVFTVEFADSNSNEENILQTDQQHLPEGAIENSTGSSLKSPGPVVMGKSSPQSGIHFLNSQQDSRATANQSGTFQYSQLPEYVVCACCGYGNPAVISSCLTCENHLQPTVCATNSTPAVLSADSKNKVLACCRCKRLNCSDARYCDWCGLKQNHAASVICWRCGASGFLNAAYCAACGVFLEAPAPLTYRDDTVRKAATHLVASLSNPICSVGLTTPTAEKYTQTVGVYDKSVTKLQKEEQKELRLNRQHVTRDHQSPLCAISPGRGYWRKQLDHVCAHLRSYAQNNTPFRALLGEPRLGRMVSAVIQQDHYEFRVTISFVLAGGQGNLVGPTGLTASPTETLSSVTERSEDSSSFRKHPSKGVMKPAQQNAIQKPTVKDAQLLKELGPGRGQISVIQELLDQGADPCCCSNNGRHALSVAVVNGHCDVLPILLQRGANVSQQSGQMKNSALHEAAAQGSEGLQCAKVLLSYKASVKQRNAGGQTAYDVALNSRCNSMVSLLAPQTG